MQTLERFDRHNNILRIPAGKVFACDNFDVQEHKALYDFYNMDLNVERLYEGFKKAYRHFGGDSAIQEGITTPSIPSLLQFLQIFLPGQVFTVTNARNIDKCVGKTVQGSWETEEVVQQILEPTGTAVPYGDTTNIPFGSWNLNYNYYTNVRFELGIEVTTLEQLRSSAANVDSAAAKRIACTRALEIQRNYVGFYGFNNGLNRTYGFLNDPNLPNYIIVATGASSSTTWASKTFNEIVADIITWAQAMQSNSGDNIDPQNTPMRLVLATNIAQQLAKVNQLGNQSVRQWLNMTYPDWEIVTAPELNNANAGQNVAYLFPERFEDDSTDDGRVFEQIVPMQFKTQGVMQEIKGYKEGYTNATCGTFVKRPWAVYRAYGM